MTAAGQDRTRLLSVIAALLVLAVLPLVADEYYRGLVTRVMALAIFAMSLDLLLGVAGLISFGHAAYFGVGAYALALLTPEYGGANLLATLPAAAGAAALVALALGALAVRTQGIYFIMVTFAFAQMGFHVVNDSRWAGGSDGLLLFAKPVIAAFGVVWLDLSVGANFYYLVLACLAATYVSLRALVGTPFGRVIQGIRVNEARMRALGYATYGYKLATFVIAGALAGVGGYLHTAHAEFANPALLDWRLSGLVLMMVILGGRGTLLGPVAGAFVMVLLQEYLAGLTRHWMLAMGLFVVLVVLFLPGGFAALFARRGRADG